MSDATQPGAEPVYATQEPLGDGLDLRHYLGIVRRRFWVILTSLVVVVTLGTVHAFRATPIYRAEGSVLIELQGPRVMGFEDITQAQGGSRDWYFYATQREMLRSQAVMEKALEQPGIREMLEGAGEATEAPPGGLRGLITEVRNTISALLGGVPSSPPAPWERLRGMAQVSVDRDTESLLRISSEGTNAAQTALVVNAVARAFAAYHIERRQRSSSEAFAFLEEQKSIQEQKLLQAEAALQEFREEVRLPTLDTSDRQNPVLVRLGRLSDRLTETQLRRIELQAQAMVRDEVLAEAPGVHLPLEVADRPLEVGAQDLPEVDREVLAALECLAPGDPHEVGVLLEEAEARGDHVVDLVPPVALGLLDRLLDAGGPLAEHPEEHLGVDRLLRREVVQDARPADADPRGDVVEGRAVEAPLGEAPACLDEDRLARRTGRVGGHGREGTGPPSPKFQP